MPDYTTWGPVRGGCAHIHPAGGDAEACADVDRAACAKLGGGRYSDRAAYEVRDGRLYHPDGSPVMDCGHHVRARSRTIPPAELRAWRETRGWSRRQLADALGVTEQAVFQWEAEGGTPSHRGMPPYLWRALRDIEVHG